MGIYSERVVPEVQGLVASTLGLPNTSIVIRATKFVRFDWRELISYFEDQLLPQGLQPPWVIVRILPEQEADWGMAVNAYTVPIEIFFIQDENNYVASQVVVGATSQNQIISPLTNIFVGQRLLWETNQLYGIVQSINAGSPITVTVDQVIPSLLHEKVSSDISSDVHVLMEKLRTAFYTATSHTNFQIVEDPVIDVSDINPVNETQQHDNYNILAGSCFVKLLVGDY